MVGMMAGLLASSWNGTFWLPEAASTLAPMTDGLFHFIYWLCVLFFVIIVGAMGYFAWAFRYKGEADVKTSPIRGNHKLEIFWSVVPSILLVVIFAWGFKGFMYSAVPPADALNVRVVGQKWSWTMTYPNGGVEANQLVVPVGTPVKLTMSSVDVLHSFFIPAFRVKRDVIPNRYTVLWFQSDEVGTHHIFCTEYCGDSHSEMIGTVRVVPMQEYLDHIESLGGCGADEDAENFADCGQRVSSNAGCVACHSSDGSRLVGPTWAGLWNAERPFTDGSSAVADENYLRESIMEPNAHIVEGYAPNQMPTYAGRLEEHELNMIIAYIESLAN